MPKRCDATWHKTARAGYKNQHRTSPMHQRRVQKRNVTETGQWVRFGGHGADEYELELATWGSGLRMTGQGTYEKDRRICKTSREMIKKSRLLLDRKKKPKLSDSFLVHLALRLRPTQSGEQNVHAIRGNRSLGFLEFR